MKTCPECGHRLGLTATRGFCSHVCRVLFRARMRRRKREKWRRWLFAFFEFPTASSPRRAH